MVRPLADRCVTRLLVRQRAEESPDQVFALFETGESWTYGELLPKVLRRAGQLQRLGVAQDDVVLAWLPNGQESLLTWFALVELGAVFAPINTAYRGALLEHVLANSGASLMVADARLVERLAEADLAGLRTLALIGQGEAPRPDLKTVALSDVAPPLEGLRPPARTVAAWDTQAVIYTSGTTGPSKGVLTSYAQMHATLTALDFRGPSDRELAVGPMFHIAGLGPIYGALLHGSSVAIAGAFSTGEFWTQIRRFKVTTATLVGAMTPFLLQAPAAPDDREHPLRRVVMVPLSEDSQAFAERFGVEVFTTFNMTETAMPIVSGANPTAPGTCGRAREGVSLRIADENDFEVADGAAGELLIRTDQPWTLSHGYLNDPAATARTWRNGWFHTGDTFRRDPAGDYFFVDRKKDAIRRRGENISSFEVEREICAHPAVREAAVVPVPSAVGEDEVLAVVALKPDATLTYADLIGFLSERLPNFMTPRYVRLMPDLPKTPTQKVEKHRLRTEGVTADTWDRDAAGIVLRRDRI